jgi:hypothetical protein
MRAEIMIHGAPGYENRTARAVVRGDLALHPSEEDDGKWTITHVPTGAAIVRLRTCRAARRAMRDLRAFNWSFAQMRGPAFQALRKEVRPVLRDFHRADDRMSGVSR